MKRLRWQGTILRFAKDVRFGCHATETEVRRSEAGKVLVALAGWGSLRAVTEYLENMPLPKDDALPLVEEGVQAGMAMLMADIGRARGVVVPHMMAYGDRDGWITWAKSIYEAT